MGNGRVYWITGLSNSGKTTVGTALYYELTVKFFKIWLEGEDREIGEYVEKAALRI